MASSYAGCNPQGLGDDRDRLREALVKIQKLTGQFDDDDHAYNDVDTLQVFENSVSDIVELALSKNRS